MALEQEVKLLYPDVEAARRAVTAAGGRLTIPRRLLDDWFFDTHDGRLRRDAQALRLRQDRDHTMLTWKGPPRPGTVKTREEIEASCSGFGELAAVLGALGYVSNFRSQKYREEYAVGEALVTVDQTPFAVFVEVEASLQAIADVVARLGRSPADYELASYAALWRRWCAEQNRPAGDMLFDEAASST